MKITLQKVGKRFNYEWIFRDIDYDFTTGKSYAITGPNGSGKSTLLKILSGHLTPSEGFILYHENLNIDVQSIFEHVSYSAPYVELLDEFTLMEMFEFHFAFKSTLNHISVDELLNISGLQDHRNKQLKTFSSGMKQRVKLVTAILSDTAILLLDEPTTNLDNSGVEWYHALIAKYTANRLVIIGSNMEREYGFCSDVLKITDFNPSAR